MVIILILLLLIIIIIIIINCKETLNETLKKPSKKPQRNSQKSLQKSWPCPGPGQATADCARPWGTQGTRMAALRCWIIRKPMRSSGRSSLERGAPRMLFGFFFWVDTTDINWYHDSSWIVYGGVLINNLLVLRVFFFLCFCPLRHALSGVRWGNNVLLRWRRVQLLPTCLRHATSWVGWGGVG